MRQAKLSQPDRPACSVARRLVSLGAIHHSHKHANMATQGDSTRQEWLAPIFY